MTENKEIIKVEDLSVTIKTGAKEIPVLRDVSFAIREGEQWAIAGESGAGKSMTMQAMTALLPEESAQIDGQILFRTAEGNYQNLLDLPYRDRHTFVAEHVAVIFQDSINALNPNDMVMSNSSSFLRWMQYGFLSFASNVM